MRASLHTWPTVVAALLFAITLAGSCGTWHWLLDLASHFRAYWLVAAAVGLVLALRRPRSAACALCALALVGNVWAMLPYWLAGPGVLAAAAAAQPGSQNESTLALILVNVHRQNPDRSLAVAYLRGRAPDVAVLIEPNAQWLADLSSLDEIYPFRVAEPRDDNFGIVVLSRWPLADTRIVTLGGTPFPNIVTTVRFRGRDIRLVATHPHPPFNSAYAAALTEQLAAVADAAAAAVPPCIVAGDFNATPWSLPYRSFRSRSGLRDTAQGRGVQPTWNARRVAPRIPIDHVFASPDLAVLHRAVGPDVGSDHFPVEVTLVLPPHD